MTIDPRTPKLWGGDARRVFTDQADIACTKREAEYEILGESREGYAASFKNHL